MQKEILLAYFPKITKKRSQDLLAVFSSFDRAWDATFHDMHGRLPWDESLIHEFLLWKDTVRPEYIEKVHRQEHIHCIFIGDPAYPTLLKEIHDPPFCLFVRGTLPKDNHTLAVVGPRKYSPYGKQVAEQFVTDLVARGCTIVSGLAIGIDSIAHAATIAAQGITIAVLGSGIDRQHVYPRGHQYLADSIVESGGAVISEYPPGALPTKYSFPKRNRLIAGLSLGVLIVEAHEKSGALITSGAALDYNREVFAIPQNITADNAAGVNALLKMGAVPTTTVDDIVNVLNLHHLMDVTQAKAIIPDSPEEERLLAHLTKEPVHVEELIRKTTMGSAEVNSTLTLMEMKGKVKNLGGMMYVRGR